MNTQKRSKVMDQRSKYLCECVDILLGESSSDAHYHIVGRSVLQMKFRISHAYKYTYIQL